MAIVERNELRTWIPGAEVEMWGVGGGPQNSVMAVLALTMRLMDEPDYDFDHLMGVSGAAFRIQLWNKAKHGTCPSSPHAMVGSNCSQLAFDAVPFELEHIEAPREDPIAVSKAFSRVRDLIDQGIPVMAFSEETDLVVGYVQDSDYLLARSYWDAAVGLREVDKLPWFMLAPVHRHGPRNRKELARKSLEFACENMETTQFGDYASGWAAFDEWCRRLAHHEWIEALPPSEFGAWLHANGFVYWSLIEARISAAAYLRRIAPLFERKEAAYILRAAQKYETEVEDVLRSPHEHQIAPMSWMRKEGDVWPKQQRQLQISKLREAEALEREAIAELECAVAVM